MSNTGKSGQDWLGLWNRHRLPIVFGTVYLLLSLFAMAHFLHSSHLGDRYYKTSFGAMYNQTAEKPFVYRQLMPFAVRVVTALTPAPIVHSVDDYFMDMRSRIDKTKLSTTLPWLREVFESRPYQRLVMIILIYACLWGYIYMLHRLACDLFPSSRAIAWFAPIFGILAISSFSFPFQYVYDIPVLFLSTACYWAIYHQRWKTYYLLFTLACFNKETVIFITFFSAIWCYRRMPLRDYMNMLLVQYVIAALIRIWLLYLYQDNVGDYLRYHLFRVLPGDWWNTSPYERVFKIAWGFFLICYQWAQKPAFLKTSLLLLPPMYVAYLLYGMPEEYRVFFDVMPLPLLMAVHTLVDCTGLSKAPFFTPVTYSPAISGATDDSSH